MDKLQAIADKPYYEIDQGNLLKNMINETPVLCPYTEMSLDSFVHTLRKHAEVLEKIKVSDVGLAVMLYQKKHGTYPDKLEELVPEFMKEIPVDGFTGKPLLYRIEKDGFVVYSLGRNMKDDGGTPQSANAFEDDFDIVWRIGTPEPEKKQDETTDKH